MIFLFRKFLIKTRLIALLFMFILALGGIAWNSSLSQSNVSAQFAEQAELVVVGLNDASLALEGALMVSKYLNEAGFYGQLKKDDIRTRIQQRGKKYCSTVPDDHDGSRENYCFIGGERG